MGQNQGFGSLGRVVGPAIASIAVSAWRKGLPFWVGGAIMLGTLWLIFDYLRSAYVPPALTIEKQAA